MAKKSRGDAINISAHGANVSINSKFRNSPQTIGSSSDRDDLSSLLKRLEEKLAALDSAHVTEAENVRRAAQEVVMVAEKGSAQPNRERLRVSADGLKRAAEAVKDIAPAVFTVAKQIVAFVSGVPI